MDDDLDGVNWGTRRLLGVQPGSGRVEAACLSALAYGAFSCKSVARIIDKELDKAPLPLLIPESGPILHPNIRGASYFLTGVGGGHAD